MADDKDAGSPEMSSAERIIVQLASQWHNQTTNMIKIDQLCTSDLSLSLLKPSRKLNHPCRDEEKYVKNINIADFVKINLVYEKMYV